MTQIPGSVPRGLDATVRGWLTRKDGPPKRMALQGGGEMVKARMGVNMAAPQVPADKREGMTNWLDVVALNPAQMERLERCEPGELVTISGPITWKPFETRKGEKRINQTIIAEYVRSASSSMPADAGKGTEAGAGDEAARRRRAPDGGRTRRRDGNAGEGQRSRGGDAVADEGFFQPRYTAGHHHDPDRERGPEPRAGRHESTACLPTRLPRPKDQGQPVTPRQVPAKGQLSPCKGRTEQFYSAAGRHPAHQKDAEAGGGGVVRLAKWLANGENGKTKVLS